MKLTDGCNESGSQFEEGKILGHSLTLVFLATSVLANLFLIQKDNTTLQCVRKKH